jgi:hypothetical protein
MRILGREVRCILNELCEGRGFQREIEDLELDLGFGGRQKCAETVLTEHQ